MRQRLKSVRLPFGWHALSAERVRVSGCVWRHGFNAERAREHHLAGMDTALSGRA